MDNISSFDEIIQLYHPTFSKESKEMQISEAEATLKRLDFKVPLRNRIIEYVSLYGSFKFSKQEKLSGDIIEYYSRPLQFCNPYWEEFNERVAFIGGYRNCSCSFCGRQDTFFIEAFYMNSAGFVYNQNKALIAESLNELLRYIIDKEYDFHPHISNAVINVLNRAGWYEGRNINIDLLIEECMDDDVFPTDIQIGFVQEYGGIKGVDLNNFGFLISNKRDDRCFANIAKQAVTTEEKRILNTYGAETLCVGYCNDGEDQIFITSYGQIIVRGRIIGRNYIEALNCIVGY